MKHVIDLESITFKTLGSSPSGTVDPEPCFDTTHMDWAGPGWTGANIPIRRFLQFVNWCTAAIKREDPKALVTVGSFSPWPQTNPGIFDEDPVHKSAFNHYQVTKMPFQV